MIECPHCKQHARTSFDEYLKAGLVVANMGDKYKRGVPELGLPSLDPMTMPMIEIEMGNNKVKMEDITSTGLFSKLL